MSVLICGSRQPKDPFGARLFCDEMVQRMEPGMVILNGGADGIDSYILDAVKHLPNGRIIDLGVNWSDKANPQPLEITAIVFRPNWKRHGRRYAPVARNLHMLDLMPEMVVALHNGSSTGTAGVVKEAERRGIETVVRIT